MIRLALVIVATPIEAVVIPANWELKVVVVVTPINVEYPTTFRFANVAIPAAIVLLTIVTFAKLVPEGDVDATEIVIPVEPIPVTVTIPVVEI